MTSHKASSSAARQPSCASMSSATRRAAAPRPRLPDQVPAAVKAQRAATLRSLSLELAWADFEARTGSCELALVERPGVGRSESYHLVAVPENAAPGSLVEFRFDGQASQLLE